MNISSKNIEIIATMNDADVVWDDMVCESPEERQHVLAELRKVKVMPRRSKLFFVNNVLWRAQIDKDTSIVKISYSRTLNEGVYYN